MGSKLPCQFCGKSSGFLSPRDMYRCKNCGTVLCHEHIDKKTILSKFLIAWSPIILLIALIALLINNLIPNNVLDTINDVMGKNAFGLMVMIIFIIQFIFWGTINWTQRKCFKCGAENTLKRI